MLDYFLEHLGAFVFSGLLEAWMIYAFIVNLEVHEYELSLHLIGTSACIIICMIVGVLIVIYDFKYGGDSNR